ncbi:lysozyme inhibitor LprI family protein [Mangrovibacter sp. SLW1]
MNGQPENVRVALRDSQRLWIKYRDAYIEAMKTYYQQEQGTIWGLVAAESIMNITRDKALDLYRLRNSTNLGD